MAILAGCAPSPPAVPESYNRPPRSLDPPFAGAAELPPPDMTNDGPGSLVEVKPLPETQAFVAANATAVRVVYRSTSSNGEPSEVSGVVAVPAGEPPKGGWPIISFGHTLTGLGEICAPSRARDLGGYAGCMSLLLNRGYVVAMSDYQGLGIPGSEHSALDWVTLANNMIDAVRAARRVLPEASPNWAALGSGQGGLAAWAAAERARDYGAGLNLVGAVALSPYADLSPLADAARGGTLTAQQNRLLMVVLESLARTIPEFDLDAYRSPLVRDHWAMLTDCAPADPTTAQNIAKQLRPDDLRPRDDAATTALRDALKAAALPSAVPPAPVPVLVAYATDDPIVPQAGIAAAVKSACAAGDSIVVMKRIGDTSATSDLVIQPSLAWLRARFDGAPPIDVCVGAA
jgi:pimeloyl-ACP methyl ester carboxylesterase